ncbi:hypothetical protein RZ229_004269 [Escherichia coli]|uniref:hypothetical protein n=1 Tax=Escherichia coli TaxID=562 RepID=UPI0018314C0B|nr:hypothetical protein [Escherichia coli]HDQ6730251.1 hypothetical protein [Escherichia coli O11:H5]EEQ4716471.1 hypothetical protein [Escherichia coli]EES7498794.1 hypothetical protein [Escherichia coli]EEV7619256.1 hypothetical protein [Escherichia coli]EEW0907884.1 hypothetical protein [Escherichia coli]
MTELTKEQLIEEAKLKIAIAKCHPNSGMARIDGELFKIALASLEAEPIAWECGENIILFNPDTVEAYAKRAEISPKPLFAAPPVPVVPEGLVKAAFEKGMARYGDAMLKLASKELAIPSGSARGLTMLVKQLAWQLRKAKPDCKLPDKAMDYLKRNGLISVEDILR